MNLGDVLLVSQGSNLNPLHKDKIDKYLVSECFHLYGNKVAYTMK